MLPLVSETIPNNVTATQNPLGLPMAVDPSPPLPLVVWYNNLNATVWHP